MKPLPHTLPGEKNDLYEFLEEYANKAKNDQHAAIYVYGSKFDTGLGMHNIHMNQGNPRGSRWENDNGTWKDGGILIQFENSWAAVFLAFQTQSWCTDRDGQPIRFCDHTEPDKEYE